MSAKKVKRETAGIKRLLLNSADAKPLNAGENVLPFKMFF